ncbi:ATP-binding domain-containing protein [uncultured Paracoccus sp.]|uniref:DEAD/DEAH box helicase n=1 Tax=uncultured Paracoccus sp. TaxID=189685 RepID=UPI00262B5553|nr:ATP-binding domain-containing protein [uncultured Paracoccus sp.]
MNDIAPEFDSDLDVIFGEYKDHEAVANFVRSAREAQLHGTLYIGYPVLTVDDEKIEYDAMLVSRDRGVVVFDLYSVGSADSADITDEIEMRQEKLYAALYNRLNSFKELRRGRNLEVDISTVSIHPLLDVYSDAGETKIAGLSQLSKLKEVEQDDRLDNDMISHLNAAIQRISNLKPRKKRDNIKSPDSKGAVIREIERKVANLDLWQKRGSIEYVNGPQRIRGLAGSGKTVVLALKAAYLHVKRPDWNIAVTFNTRSLYQQFESLVNRFVFSQISEEPDWERIQILHAWGGSDRTGIYRKYCEKTSTPYRDFSSASRMFGYDTAFKGACDEAIAHSVDEDLNAFDVVLIDEAQDLPSSFFQIVYRLTKTPKRIVWAYDDLQNLSDVQLPSAKELFGLDRAGNPKVTLVNSVDMPQQDIVLPRCYRNPPWTLLSAHGLGFGVHRQPMAQMFTDPEIWKRLGYVAKKGELKFDRDVEIVRSPQSIPSFFHDLLSPSDTLVATRFDSTEDQYQWVAAKIKSLISTDELEASDILIILPNVRHSKSEGSQILRVLTSAGITAHIPGQTSSRDEIFREGSIAITHIYRAKGNEAPVVFVLNSEFCESTYGIKQRRNILFTAMTRSRAWTYVLGVGDRMNQIEVELAKIKNDEFSLDFHYPTKEAALELSVSSDPLDQDDVVEEFDDLRTALKKARGKWDQLPLDLQRELSSLSGGVDE